MIVLDVSVLLAFVRVDHPQHDAARAWWDVTAASGRTVTAPDVVWSGVVRIATNARVFDPPASLEEIFGVLAAIVAQPTYLSTTYVEGVLEAFGNVCRESRATAGLVSDAYVAAFASCLGASVVTFDRDFRRFDGLDVIELA